jgi:hypothetical protein
MFTPNQFQTQLFDEIFGSTKGKSKITQDLMQILGCSRASLYRKRTGSTPLTADELIKLANHFSISIDALRKDPEENSLVVVCSTLPPIKEYSDIYYYIENTQKNLSEAVKKEEAQLYFIAKELPLYRYMSKHCLSAFRFYLWNLENLRRHEKFDPQNTPSELRDKGAELTRLSEAIKTTEYWVPTAFDNLINQIKYVYKNQLMSKRILETLKAELHEVLDTLIQNIRTERTAEGKPYQMILSHYLTLSDGALLEIGPTTNVVMFSYSSINYLKSSNPNVVEAFKRGLRYHKLEGQALDHLETEAISAFEQLIRSKINAL